MYKVCKYHKVQTKVNLKLNVRNIIQILCSETPSITFKLSTVQDKTVRTALIMK